jgi:hypothetical protein
VGRETRWPTSKEEILEEMVAKSTDIDFLKSDKTSLTELTNSEFCKTEEELRLTTSNRSPKGILTERNWLRPVSKGVNTMRARIRLGGYSQWWTSPSLNRRYGRTR